MKAPNGVGYTYIWYKNNVVIAGATTSTYYATLIGNYKVRVTAPSGCYKTSPNTAVTKSCKVAGDIIPGELTLYPNPANNKVYLSLQLEESENNDLIINITDVTGKLILTESGELNNGELLKEVDVSSWPAGMYTVKIEGDNFVFTKQLIVSK